jgi:hypothetical protein
VGPVSAESIITIANYKVPGHFINKLSDTILENFRDQKNISRSFYLSALI